MEGSWEDERWLEKEEGASLTEPYFEGLLHPKAAQPTGGKRDTKMKTNLLWKHISRCHRKSTDTSQITRLWRNTLIVTG